MSLIQISNLSFGYEGSYDMVFENLSLQLDSNWKLGLVGRNGKGKTTLLKLLQGVYQGTGSISASVQFQHFPPEIQNQERLAISILEEVAGETPVWKLMRELSLLGASEELLYRPFETLSQGEQTKLLLAGLFLVENGFMLIDEPTNHLDMAGRELVAEYLRQKKGFILVSHDRAFLDGAVDHILAINRSSVTLQKGDYSSWQANKMQSDQKESSQNAKLRKEIHRLSDAAKRTASWSEKLEKTKYDTRNAGLRPDRGYIGSQAARMMKRAKSIEQRRYQAVEERSALLKDIEAVEDLKISPLDFHSQRLIEAKDVSICYGAKTVCEGLHFELLKGDRLAIIGRNGSGKSSLLKLICGEAMDYRGEFYHAQGLSISYLSQDTSHLSGDLKEYAKIRGIDESLFKTILRKLDFTRIQFEKPMEDFSQGQKKKVLLAASLSEQAHLYIWDEPLNYIDLFSRMQIEAVLRYYQPTLLFVEHDRTFCEEIATKLLLLP